MTKGTIYQSNVYNHDMHLIVKSFSAVPLRQIWFDMTVDFKTYGDKKRILEMMQENYEDPIVLSNHFGVLPGYQADISRFTQTELDLFDLMIVHHNDSLFEVISVYDFLVSQYESTEAINPREPYLTKFEKKIVSQVKDGNVYNGKKFQALIDFKEHALSKCNLDEMVRSVYMADRYVHWQSRLERTANTQCFKTKIKPYVHVEQNTRKKDRMNGNGIMIKETDVEVYKK